MITSTRSRAPSPSSRTSVRRLAGGLRALARGLRRVPDRVLHRLRRRAAWNMLRGRGVPTLTLVVCHGNICRSPYAAGVLSRLLEGATCARIGSAGFDGPDRPSPPEAIAVAAGRGVDLSDHRSKLLMLHDVLSADLIVVMDAAQRRAICHGCGRRRRDVVVLGDLDPAPIAARAIRDPLNQPLHAFETSYARIDRCLAELVRALESPPEA